MGDYDYIQLINYYYNGIIMIMYSWIMMQKSLNAKFASLQMIGISFCSKIPLEHKNSESLEKS
jgi:hypothetical protein